MPDSMHYILIDDDSINNTICRLSIKKTLGPVPVTAFTNPRHGFEFVANGNAVTGSAKSAVVFLDINMPEINGWDFLEMFEQLDEKVKNEIRIYLLSSSINQHDIDRAKADKNVVNFISKPLSREILMEISKK